MKILRHTIFVLMILSLFYGNVYAEKINEFLDISSDNLKLENDNNLAIFSGNVMVEFEGIKIKTDVIKVKFTKENTGNKIETIEIPNNFQAINSCKNEIVLADNGLYSASDKTLSFKKNVMMKKDNYILRTNHFVYYNVLYQVSD